MTLGLLAATVLLALAVASAVLGLSGDPCADDRDWALLLLVTGPSAGMAVFAALFRRLRLGWVVVCAVSVALVAGAGAWILGLVRWVENCTR